MPNEASLKSNIVQYPVSRPERGLVDQSLVTQSNHKVEGNVYASVMIVTENWGEVGETRLVRSFGAV